MNIETILNTIQIFASVAASVSVAFAVISYFDAKNQENKTAAIHQISFFRREIIPANDEYISLVKKKKGVKYTFSRVGLDTPTIDYVKEHYDGEVKKQVELHKEMNLHQKQTLILNMMEELSLKMDHFRTTNSVDTDSIKLAFVELVELHAVALLLERELLASNTTYSSILETYQSWKDIVDRRDSHERQESVLRRLHTSKRDVTNCGEVSA